MKWSRDTDIRIRSDSGYVIHKDAPDTFLAWGPVGSQDIDYIRACTAAALRRDMQIERRPQDLQMTAGRALVGIFTDPDEARAACEADAVKDSGGKVSHETPASRTTDPESSRE